MAVRKLGLIRSNNETEFTPSEFWANVGFTAGNEDGTSTFIKLPVGIPLDNLESKKLGGSPRYQAAVLALIKSVQDKAKALEPGEATIVNLQVEIRRVGNTPEISKDDPWLIHAL